MSAENTATVNLLYGTPRRSAEKRSASAASIVKSILFNENQIYPVTVYVDGAYDLKGVFLSVPTIIDKTGAKEVVEIKLQPDEEAALQKSASLLKSFYEELEM